MNDEKQHAHFICRSCERVYCNDDPRYGAMVDGDACPSCHVATVEQLPEFDATELPEVAQTMRETLERFAEQQSLDTRLRVLIEAAARVYPYVHDDLNIDPDKMPLAYASKLTLPSEVRRAVAAANIAVVIEDQVLKALKRHAAQERQARRERRKARREKDNEGREGMIGDTGE